MQQNLFELVFDLLLVVRELLVQAIFDLLPDRLLPFGKSWLVFRLFGLHLFIDGVKSLLRWRRATHGG